MIGNMCVGMESAITLVYIAHYCTERKGICEVCSMYVQCMMCMRMIQKLGLQYVLEIA